MGNRIFTVPNWVSFVRLAAIPYFWWVLLAEERVGLAAALIFLIGSTDWVDGYLARRLDQVTELGKVLDPVADRLIIGSALVGGLVAGVLPGVIGWPLLIREAVVGFGALVLATRGLGKLEVKSMGKTATFLLYGAIPSFYLAEADIAAWLFAPSAWIASVVGLVLYWWVGVEYGVEVRQRLATVESNSIDERMGILNVPEQFRYSEEHEWLETLPDGTIRVGITDYAQDQLGDVVFVDLTDAAGAIEKGAVLGEVESTKSVAEVYAPVSGNLVRMNEKLIDAPELINSDPYGEGWFAIIEPAEALGDTDFIDADAYRALTE